VTAINCTLAPINAGLDLPQQLTNSLQQQVSSKYSAFSHQAVQLTVGLATLPPPYSARMPVSAYQLHSYLTTITGNSITPINIAVLYASSYNVPGLPYAQGAFGVMFDRGFKTPDDPNDPLQRPRIGCAVFLDTIKAQRTQEPNYFNEVTFTTLHELGHIFNLGHIQDGANIMSSSPSGPKGIDSKLWNFEPAHAMWLTNCGNDSRVTPGGDPYIGDGADQGGFNAPTKRQHSSPTPSLTLEIQVWPRDFYMSEPVQLDILISGNSKDSRISIPAEMDPGFRRFRLFVQDPRGERRMYQSPMNFCGSKGVVRLNGSRYRRDLPLFGQAGGYTFQRAGLYKIQLEVQITKKTVLKSNVVEIQVRSELPPRRGDAGLFGLRESRVAKLLYYGHDLEDQKGIHQLDEWLRRGSNRSLPSFGIVNYIWAKASLRDAARFSPRSRRVAADRLKLAEQHGHLGDHRRRRITDLIEEAQSALKGKS